MRTKPFFTKLTAVIIAAGWIASTATGPVTAIPAPRVERGDAFAPVEGPGYIPRPILAMHIPKFSRCNTSGVAKDSQFQHPPANEWFHVNDSHKFATGKGIIVAVIDTGVTPSPRLNIVGGGDYVGSADGLEDCDHHGTLVAGIIGAHRKAGDGFIGVAPDAALISIRQISGIYKPVSAPDDYQVMKPKNDMQTLAEAIVRAANLGAKVINISLTACTPAEVTIDTRKLGGAIWYAAIRKDAVIVASAGNAGNECKSNPGWDPSNPGDTRNWSGVKSVSWPSAYSQYVLSVGGTTITGDPWQGTMAGPWVGVGAVAENIVSLDPAKGSHKLVNAYYDTNDHKLHPLVGTSFSAAYVAGLAALIREKYPTLTAHQVINRIVNSAHDPSDANVNLVGYGVVDPIFALTGDVFIGDPYPKGAILAKVSIIKPKSTSVHISHTFLISSIAGAFVIMIIAVLIRIFQRK